MRSFLTLAIISSIFYLQPTWAQIPQGDGVFKKLNAEEQELYLRSTRAHVRMNVRDVDITDFHKQFVAIRRKPGRLSVDPGELNQLRAKAKAIYTERLQSVFKDEHLDVEGVEVTGDHSVIEGHHCIVFNFVKDGGIFLQAVVVYSPAQGNEKLHWKQYGVMTKDKERGKVLAKTENLRGRLDLDLLQLADYHSKAIDLAKTFQTGGDRKQIQKKIDVVQAKAQEIYTSQIHSQFIKANLVDNLTMVNPVTIPFEIIDDKVGRRKILQYRIDYEVKRAGKLVVKWVLYFKFTTDGKILDPGHSFVFPTNEELNPPQPLDFPAAAA